MWLRLLRRSADRRRDFHLCRETCDFCLLTRELHRAVLTTTSHLSINTVKDYFNMSHEIQTETQTGRSNIYLVYFTFLSYKRATCSQSLWKAQSFSRRHVPPGRNWEEGFVQYGWIIIDKLIEWALRTESFDLFLTFRRWIHVSRSEKVEIKHLTWKVSRAEKRRLFKELKHKFLILVPTWTLCTRLCAHNRLTDLLDFNWN